MLLSMDLEDEGIDLVDPDSLMALEYSTMTGESGFLYILSCSDGMKEYTGANSLALGSLLGFRKHGRC